MTVIISFSNQDDSHFGRRVHIIPKYTAFRNAPVRIATAPTRHRIASEPSLGATRQCYRFNDRLLLMSATAQYSYPNRIRSDQPMDNGEHTISPAPPSTAAAPPDRATGKSAVGSA